MARIAKTGLDYFPLDVTFLTNRKIKRLMKTHGPEASGVVLATLAAMYADKGYYLKWDEDMCFELSEQLCTEEETVQAIITDAMRLDVFNAEMFEKHAVITSENIQKQYLECTRKRKNVKIEEAYRLTEANCSAPQEPDRENPAHANPTETIQCGIKVPQKALCGTQTPICGTQTPLWGAEMQQSKVKESKGK